MKANQEMRELFLSACGAGDIEQLKLVVEKSGFDQFDARDRMGLSALHLVSLSNAPTAPQVVDYLIGKAGPSLLDLRSSIDSETPLHAAIRNSNLPVVDAMLLHGARLDAKDSQEITPAMAAALCDDDALFDRVMSEPEASLDPVEDVPTATVLHLCISEVKCKLALRALKHMTRFDCVTKHRETALYEACSRGSMVDLCRELIRRGANVHHRKPVFGSMLHRAVHSPEIISDLVAAGLDVNDKSEGNTPLMSAIDAMKIKSVRLLLSHGADVITDGPELLHKVLAKPSWDPQGEPDYPGQIFKLLKDAGLKIDARGEGGVPPLHVACRKRELDVIEDMIASGLDVNAVWRNETPLHCAINSSEPQKVQCLLKHGANPLADDNYLHMAMNSRSIEIVQILLDAGVNPRIRDASGEDAIEYARKYVDSGFADQVQALIQAREAKDNMDRLLKKIKVEGTLP